MIKKIYGLLVLLGVVLSLTGYGQTREDLLRLGNEAFEEENYASAAYFYNKLATGSNSGLEEIVYPYDLKHSNRVKEEKIDSLSSDTTAIDSLAVDTTSIQIAIVEVREDSSGLNLELGLEDVEMIYIYHRLAESYRLDYNYDHAEPWFEKAVKSPHPEFPIVVFRYGEILMNNEKYEEARDQFSDFVTNAPSEGEGSDLRNAAKQKMKSCNYALKNNGHVKDITVAKADSILNNGTAVFGASFFGSETVIAFSSVAINQNQSSENETYSLYLSSHKNNVWNNPDLIPDPISTLANEGSVCINPKGSKLYFTRWDNEGCAIYASNNFNGRWMEPYKLEDINIEGYKTMNPNLSLDGRTLYFSSNNEGGKGGMDIWSCNLDRWGHPKNIENLGARINTSGDEISPFMLSNANKLFFSSTGHPGFGGLDVFYSEFQEETGWTRVKNLGKPINSGRDDAYYITSFNAKNSFFSSDRESCDECGHGNCMKLYTCEKGPPRFFLDGFVFDSETDLEIPTAKVTIMDVKKHEVAAIIETDETGYYSLSLEANKIYFIKGQKESYFGDANSVTTMGLTESRSFMVDLYLNAIPLGEIDIPGIEYDYDKATLRDTSKVILDELYEFLVLNDNLQVELRSHTDDRGTHEYNINLSQERAQSCVDYLVSKGINIARITPVGLGETSHKVEEAETEEEHQLNRRTAFYVVGQHFGE
ncbi:MAG: OmpA family protein [Flavobacteriales bacterium]|nr:OmpA family protein [Flavobacteriales bacterium]